MVCSREVGWLSEGWLNAIHFTRVVWIPFHRGIIITNIDRWEAFERHLETYSTESENDEASSGGTQWIVGLRSVFSAVDNDEGGQGCA
ncbi:MAG TPA: hypothetical protein VF199_02745 [Bacillales bacterium]